MKKLKYKVGDTVIGIKDDPGCPKIKIIGKIGTITKLNNTTLYPYRVEFEEVINYYDYTTTSISSPYGTSLRENEITPINKLKLKALLTLN